MHVPKLFHNHLGVEALVTHTFQGRTGDCCQAGLDLTQIKLQLFVLWPHAQCLKQVCM